MSLWNELLKFLAGQLAEQDLKEDGADGLTATVSKEIESTGYSMPVVTLTRNGDGSGHLVAPGFECDALENLELEIPVGSYQVNWEYSPRLERSTYRLVHVTGRSGILIHPANYQHELLGCIALGKKAGAAIENSRATVEAFEDHMGRDSFILEVR